MSIESDARRVLADSTAEALGTRARRRKVATPIVTWESYPHEFVPLLALHMRWGETVQTLRKWVRTGKLPAVRIGRALKVRKAEAQAFELAARYQVAV